jgi:hypothetical protein
MPKKRKPSKPVKPKRADRIKKKPGRKPIKKPKVKKLVKKALVKKAPIKKTPVKKKLDYEKALRDGQLAKINLFSNLGKRIGDGDKLNASEIKLFNTLEKEFESELNEGLPAPKKPALLQTNLDAADYCGFTTRMISYHVTRGNIKANKDGTFDRSELDRFLATKGGRRKKTATAIDDKKDAADLRWRIARARREEMLVSQMRGNLAAWEEVDAQWRERVVMVTSGLEAFKNRLPGVLVGKSRRDIQDVLEDEIKLLREAYATHGKYCPNEKTNSKNIRSK